MGPWNTDPRMRLSWQGSQGTLPVAKGSRRVECLISSSSLPARNPINQ